MIMSKEDLVEEYINIVNNYYPRAGAVLKYCYVKIIECYIETLRSHFFYIGIYYPQQISAEIQAHRKALQEIAENMGLVEVVCINANRLIRDPLSKLKRENPRFWLELYWIATHINEVK